MMKRKDGADALSSKKVKKRKLKEHALGSTGQPEEAPAPDDGGGDLLDPLLDEGAQASTLC